MVDIAYESTHPVFRVQSNVLSDLRLTAEAKLLFCCLACFDGFRSGWLVEDSQWSKADVRILHQLAAAGHIDLRVVHNGHIQVGLRAER